jgi:hypothetical protein
MEKPMASEGRDRNFDKALARHLRSAAASNESADLSAGAASQAGACPDSETLAAYHERSLLPEEMNSWKEHIVGCGNCQTILAQLEATDEIPLQLAGKDELLAAKESEPVLAARRLPAKSRRARLLTGARWQWLAPAGAIAAGLLIWIAWHENQVPSLPSPTGIKIAANPPASTRPPSLQREPAQPQTALSSPKSPSVLDERTRARAIARDETPESNQRLSADMEAIGALANPGADKGAFARKDKTRNAPGELPSETKAGDLEAKTGGRAVQDKVELQEQTSNAQAQNQYNNVNVAPKAPGPAPLGQMESAKRMKAAPPPPAPVPAAPSKEVMSYSTDASTELVAVVSNPRLIPAPGSGVVWRAGRAGLLEYSKDGGASWSRQTSGVLVDLLTGSALSEKVCWVIGRVGAILLTTDGGDHWKMVASPMSEDLGGIRATDALHATIWNAKNTKTFETSDGGLTWQRTANP